MSAFPRCPGCGGALSRRISAVGDCPGCMLRRAFAPAPDVTVRPADFGDFELEDELGRGGMGVVFRARQRSLDRRIALKLLPFDLLESEDFLERFEREARLMARLTHPGIARVFEAGISTQGQAYLALELVPGVPLDDYLHQQAPALSLRLDLFLQICEAVQHAHQRGIIHRDLKPSNVLVSTAEARVTAKVIDFGLARPTGEETSDAAIWRSQPAMVGTPLYLSPEQAAGGEVDTRSDVYALGAMLYEMLAGRPPFTEADFTDGSRTEVQRVLAEREPLAPSRHRGALAGVEGDLDAICLRALSKQPSQRYPTVAALTEDVRRHLALQPVLARAQTRSYRGGRFLRRHRAMLALASVVVLGLLGAAVFSAWQARVAGLERDRSRRVKAFLFTVLGAPAPGADGREVRVIDVLAEARTRAEREFPDDPLTRAEVLLALGTTYYELSQYAEAEPCLRAALADAQAAAGEHSLPSAHALKALMDLCNFTSRLEEATALGTQAVAIFRRESPRSADLLRALHGLATTRLHQGDHPGALPLLEEAVSMGRRLGAEAETDTLIAQGDLAGAYHFLNRLPEARRLLEGVLATMRARPRLRENLSSLLSTYSEILLEIGDPPAAELAMQESYARRQELYGPRSQSAGIGLGRLAWVRFRRGDLGQAEAGARESLEILRAVSPPGARELFHPLRALGLTLAKAGKADEAELVLMELLEVSERHMKANARLIEQVQQQLLEVRQSRRPAEAP